ncbi:MAG: GNAT family N-acetyltransferase [Ktedonobacterales bacterium]|nr:GNAT family N-acetyltransferase [Ktedonobacterales bacterium]
MDYTLRQIAFTEDALPHVQDFDCGAEPWALEVAAYLRDAGSVARWIKSGTDAWLYMTADGELVGYSTLSERLWRWPNSKKSARMPISVIPAVAVHRDFQGQPTIPGIKRYSDQILDHLRFEAQRHHERLPVLGLCVHPENAKAIGWYKRAGFIRLEDDWMDRETGTAYWRMALDLGTEEEQSGLKSTPQAETAPTAPQPEAPGQQPPHIRASSGPAALNAPSI